MIGLDMSSSADARKSTMHLSDIILDNIVRLLCYVSDLYKLWSF